MKSALRLAVCVALAGAFAPAFAQSAPEAAPAGASKSGTRGNPARADERGAPSSGGIGTETPKGGFQRTSNDLTNPAPGEQAEGDASRREAARRADQVYVQNVWVGP